MTKAMELAGIPIKQVKDAFELLLFMAPGNSLLVEVSAKCICTDIDDLDSRKPVAGYEERNVNDVLELSPRMPLPPVIVELPFNIPFFLQVPIHYDQSLVSSNAAGSR
jgi:hypothetical protein